MATSRARKKRGPILVERQAFGPIPSDTTTEAYRVQIEALRRLEPDRRSDLVAMLCRGLRRTVEAGVRQRHPDYDEKRVKMPVIRLAAGAEIFRQLLPDEDVSV